MSIGEGGGGGRGDKEKGESQEAKKGREGAVNNCKESNVYLVFAPREERARRFEGDDDGELVGWVRSITDLASCGLD